jgi:hypothetical protein
MEQREREREKAKVDGRKGRGQRKQEARNVGINRKGGEQWSRR